ncbi:histidine kinase [Skermanella aerolata KACC 11604]|nr:histidine kinase [Skermanella aerolata KACC 11604]
MCQAKRRAERAEFADLAKTEFLATMSHELRTPLNAILGFAELLKNQSFGPLGSARYVGYAADIHDSGQLLLQIISDIMDVAKVETGRINLTPDWVDATHLMASVARLIEPRAAAAGISFEIALPEQALPRLWADERLIKQALLNVLSNAVKFTPSGGSIRMTAMIHPLTGKMEIEIADTGLGIAKSELSKVFEPFHRGDGAMNRRFEGTGLGLPLARSFVELHGGSLTLDSVQGQGTTVHVALLPAPPHDRDEDTR